MATKPADTPVGTRMSYWIAHTLQTERERAGLSRADIARPLGVNDITIKRLESGKTMGRDIDHYVAAYAFVLGLPDGRALWDRAVDNYYKHGSAPVFSIEDGPAAAFAQAIREVVLRQRPDAPERTSGQPSKRKRRAG